MELPWDQMAALRRRNGTVEAGWPWSGKGGSALDWCRVRVNFQVLHDSVILNFVDWQHSK